MRHGCIWLCHPLAKKPTNSQPLIRIHCSCVWLCRNFRDQPEDRCNSDLITCFPSSCSFRNNLEAPEPTCKPKALYVSSFILMYSKATHILKAVQLVGVSLKGPLVVHHHIMSYWSILLALKLYTSSGARVALQAPHAERTKTSAFCFSSRSKDVAQEIKLQSDIDRKAKYVLTRILTRISIESDTKKAIAPCHNIH